MKLLPFLDLRGQWSIDVMQNGEDFWIIDMALAKDSALLSCVPKDKIKAVRRRLDSKNLNQRTVTNFMNYPPPKGMWIRS